MNISDLQELDMRLKNRRIAHDRRSSPLVGALPVIGALIFSAAFILGYLVKTWWG